MRDDKIETDDILIEEIEEPKNTNGNLLGSYGRPQKKETEKARNKVMLYFTDDEISQIKNACYIDGFEERNKGKWIKNEILKSLRRI